MTALPLPFASRLSAAKGSDSAGPLEEGGIVLPFMEVGVGFAALLSVALAAGSWGFGGGAEPHWGISGGCDVGAGAAGSGTAVSEDGGCGEVALDVTEDGCIEL